jgi:hypothetical protein
LIKKLEDSDKNNLIKIDYKPPDKKPKWVGRIGLEKPLFDPSLNYTLTNNTFTRMMDRNPKRTAFITASTIASVTFTAKAVVVGLSAIGIASPVGPGIAVALLLANELAKIYQANKNLLLVMQDMTIILSNIYKLNNLIDKSSKVFFIYMLQDPQDNKKSADGTNGVTLDMNIANSATTSNNHITNTARPTTDTTNTTNTNITNSANTGSNSNGIQDATILEKLNEINAKFETIDKSIQSHDTTLTQITTQIADLSKKHTVDETDVFWKLDVYADEKYVNTEFDKINKSIDKAVEDQHGVETEKQNYKVAIITQRINNMLAKNGITTPNTLFGKIRKDPDIQSRLYDKIQYLIVYLFKLSPKETLHTLYSDASVKNSGIGSLLEKEFKDRGVDPAKTEVNMANAAKKLGNLTTNVLSTANRVYMRTMESKTVTNKMVQDLCIINGYFSLMKSQYDFEWDYYARMLKKEEYDRIWSVIQAQREYKDFMVKENMDDLTKQIFAEQRNNLNKIGNEIVTKTDAPNEN